MPGVIMEDGSRNGAHTNHDRETLPNGTNGATYTPERTCDKGKARVEPQPSLTHSPVANGLNRAPSDGAPLDGAPQSQINLAESIPLDMAERIQNLPPEIVHITEGFEPLSRLVTRLAQVTHNRLSAKIMELAAIPTPSSAVNGNGVYYSNGADDNSVDNVKKKVDLLKFAEETHANWTKALVITQWSRVSEDVSKVIDLKVHLDGQRNFYDAAVYELSEVKRSLVHARVPNPDLRTAVEVLSTGKASWMPDLRYVEQPPLTATELLKSLQDLNTLLSIRLNLHEYDKIPLQFKDYSIKSGRVTFRVAGEFEVDLTVADENPEKQFWFIDFRFLFTPAVSELPENLRVMIERRVNAALEKDGLAGCYKYLHEFVLTHKISELRRQAVELSRGRWIETLQVEALHRALSIQYWVDRYGKDGPKSWIIVGVHSGKLKEGISDPKTTSHISLRWFRDSKEVKDHDIPLELTQLSAETLLQTVISRHIFHILKSTYRNLRTKQLFSNRQLSISFKISQTEPREPELKVQMTRHDSIAVTIEAATGRFAFRPASRLATQSEWKLNAQSRDPAANAHEFIENLRCVAVSEEIISRALSVGWIPIRKPGLKQEDLRPIFPRDTMQLSWFRRAGWSHEWFVALSASMSGERWWLIEITNSPQGPKISSHFLIPLKTTSPNHSYTFLSDLHLFAAALISYFADLRALHSLRARYLIQKGPAKSISSVMKLPSVFVKLSDVLPSKNKAPRTGKSWAKDVLRICFQGLEYPSKALGTPPLLSAAQPEVQSTPAPEAQVSSAISEVRKSEDADEMAIMIAEACLSKPMPPSLDLVKQRVDKDIAFHPNSGAFAFRLHTRVGKSAITALVERLQRVEQLVDFVEVVQKHEKTLHCETVSLGKVIFSYRSTSSVPENPDAMAIDQERSTYHAIVDFSSASTPMTLTLEAGNPQLRILDHLTKTLNSPLGLNGVATFLPLTLPLMTALAAIEDAWTSLVDRGDVLVFSRAIDWHIVRYNLASASPDQKARNVMLEIRLQHRRGDPWWCVRREKERDRGERRNSSSSDEIDMALKPVWEDNPDGEKWRGMSTSGIARMDGIEELVRRIDDVIRGVAVKGMSSVGLGLKEIPQLLTPASQKEGQSQAQSQSQNRGQNQHVGRNGQKREMIVID